MELTKTRGRRSDAKGAFIYTDAEDNHVIWPGGETRLNEFLGQSYKGIHHKQKNAHSSNSEDALTWSCFDVLANVSQNRRALALEELWELAYAEMAAPAGLESSAIHVGKTYGVGKETTEVDLSFEGDHFLAFVEAKLYSPMSQADPDNGRPHNQIARKLTIGLRAAQGKDFYFILLDIAPIDCLAQLKPHASLKEAEEKASGFGGKWLTSYWYSRYKYGHAGSLKPLTDLLTNERLGASPAQVAQVADRMGWLTWADVFKVVLRAVIPAR